ncbi:MAG: class I SAM-dependent methyltransferase [Bacteroidota bacterium]
MKVNSPFSASVEAVIVYAINTEYIISGYMKMYNIDVSNNFKNLNQIYLCKCPLTSLEFFYPLNLDGNSDFYEQLSLNNWYYNVNRWEHKEIINRIKEETSILEIGSGDGVFLNNLTSQKKISYTGLELNLAAIEKAKLKRINLISETLANHVSKTYNVEKYDIVCSFQVLEHISDINLIIQDSLKALKKGGRLIVAVPNNDASFMKNNSHPSKYLNMPPHHVNLFNEQSLYKLQEIFNLKLCEILKEPIQENHIDVLLYNEIARIFNNYTFFAKLFWYFKLNVFIKPFYRLTQKSSLGHTIIAIYEK